MTPQRSQDARSASIFMETDIDLPTLLLALLPPRRDAAVPIARLARMAGASKRATEEALQELAGSGKFPVCAGTEGIWLGSVDEVEQYIDRLRWRLVNQYRRIRALRRCARAMRGIEQQTLWAA